MKKSDIVEGYCVMYPGLLDTQLARKLTYARPDIFPDFEQARDSVKYVRGHHGQDKREVRERLGKEKYFTPGNIKIPPAKIIDRTPVQLPESCKNILILPDIHCPFHDSEALLIALEYGYQKNIDTIVLNGDYVDFHKISYFGRKRQDFRLGDEVELSRNLLKELRKNFSGKIYYLKGNHEIRLERLLEGCSDELIGIPEFEIKYILHCIEHEIEVIDDERLVMIGKLPIHHGHYVFKGRSIPVNPARTAYLKTKSSILCSHLHRTSEHSETDMTGKMDTCWSTGCLCELNPSYDPIVTKWNLGFARVRIIDEDGNYRVSNKRIYKGKVR